MTTITDFSNELHVRLYVAELLKDNIKDADFTEQAERMLCFATKNTNLPAQPKIPESSKDMFSNWLGLLSGINGIPPKQEISEIENNFHKYKSKNVSDLKSGKTGIIVGYSKDFDSLIALCNPPHKGISPGDDDFLMIDKNLITQGIFYISVKEVKKQIDNG